MFLSSSIVRSNGSNAILKRRGDIGSPCLRPLCCLIGAASHPLIDIWILVSKNNFYNIPMKESGKLKFFIIISKYCG